MGRGGKREAIMRAAERLFASRRFHEVTLDEVARAARVGKGTLYLYFRGKDDLFFQVAMAGFDELCEVLRLGSGEGDPFPEALREACRRITAFVDSRRALFRMMQSDAARACGGHGRQRERWRAQRVRLVEALSGILARGAAEGGLQSPLAPEVQAAFLLGMLRTRARDLDEAKWPIPTVEETVDLFLRGAAGKGGNL